MLLKQIPKITISLSIFIAVLFAMSTVNSGDQPINLNLQNPNQTIQKPTDFISTLTTEEQKYLQTKKVVTMCNNPNWTPLVFAKDGNQNDMQGIAIDTLKEIEKRLDIKFKNIPTKNWKEGQQYLKDKKVDILPCYIKSAAREKYANFTRPYLRLPLAIFAAKDKPIVSGLDEVMDKSWTRQKSSGLIKKIQKEYPETKIIKTSGDRESFQYVNSGKAFFTIATLPVASHVISKYMFNDLQIIGYTDFTYFLHIAVNDDDKILFSILDKALADIPEERSKEIFRKWVNSPIKEPVTDYKLLGQILLILSIVGVLLLYRHYILHKNITKLRITEQKLVKSKEEWEKTFNAITDIVTLQDADMNIVKINQAGCDELDLNYDYIIDHHCYELFRGSNEPCPGCPILVTQKTFSPCSKEMTYEKLGQTYLVSSAPVISEDGTLTHIAHVAKNITEQKKIEKELFQAHKMESIGLMAGGVAHDLNNILSGIIGYPELLLKTLPENSELRPTIEAIHESGYRAATIVADLLTIARGVAIKCEDHDINTLIENYLNSPECKRLRSLHPNTTFQQLPGSPNLFISCSPVHVKKCLMNLVTNAAEAVGDNGTVTISSCNRNIDTSAGTEVNIAAGEYVVVSVQDNGPGIAIGDLEHIFEPFYTKKVMGKSGTGLGLTVVWNTMEDHDGKVIVDSDAQGTCFQLYFPTVREAEKTLGVDNNNNKEVISGNGEHILVVDDEPHLRDIANQMLQSLGYKVDVASSGKEAVQFVKDKEVDLIVLDMLMEPGMNGREAYEEILTLNPEQRAIVASGFSESEDVKVAIKLGANGFIKKPYSMDQLGRAVKKALNN